MLFTHRKNAPFLFFHMTGDASLHGSLRGLVPSAARNSSCTAVSIAARTCWWINSLSETGSSSCAPRGHGRCTVPGRIEPVKSLATWNFAEKFAGKTRLGPGLLTAEESLVLLPGVHVAGTGSINWDGMEPVGMCVHDLPRRFVSAQGGELLEESPREHHRMPTPAAIRYKSDLLRPSPPRLDHCVDDRVFNAGLIPEQYRHRLCSWIEGPDPGSIRGRASLTEIRILNEFYSDEIDSPAHLSGGCTNDHNHFVERRRPHLGEHVAKECGGSEREELLGLT